MSRNRKMLFLFMSRDLLSKFMSRNLLLLSQRYFFAAFRPDQSMQFFQRCGLIKHQYIFPRCVPNNQRYFFERCIAYRAFGINSSTLVQGYVEHLGLYVVVFSYIHVGDAASMYCSNLGCSPKVQYEYLNSFQL